MNTGRTNNIKLGSGDAEKFDLLGGAFGTGGDIIRLAKGAGRFFKKNKSIILGASVSAGSASSGSTGGGRTRSGFVTDRTHAK